MTEFSINGNVYVLTDEEAKQIGSALLNKMSATIHDGRISVMNDKPNAMTFSSMEDSSIRYNLAEF
jgi:hypothetical protein